jgi:HPt (histidine-containing phosphotransfer) domain-containing protein
MTSENLIYSSLASDPDLSVLVAEFVQNIPARLAQIDDCFARGDRDQLCTRLHQLKGACGSYGFHPLTPLATELEKQLLDGNEPAELTANWQRFKAACARMSPGPAYASAQSCGETLGQEWTESVK